ncbi:MAG: YbjN domain-containing protein [Alphaproteobacteria bacterium]|nr:YbjN domain-containing protein [Alphaproteobacteria bacterium]
MTSFWHEPNSASLANPLDLAEQVLSERDWVYDRAEQQALYADYEGAWCNYRIMLSWHEAFGALTFSCAMDTRIAATALPKLYPLLAKINQQLWLGHFDLTEDQKCMEFRYSMLLKGVDGVSLEQVEDLLDIAITESEKFYPAFQSLIWGDKSAEDVLRMVLMDTQGEA